MPCRDYYDDHPDQYFKDVTEPALKKQVSFAESALCATLGTMQTMLKDMGAISTDPLDYINYEEAGMSRTALEVWWTNHKRLDAKHRAEAAEKARAAALAKLTPEERKILGLK